MRCFFTVFRKCLQNPMIRQWRKNWHQTIPKFAQKRKCAHSNSAPLSAARIPKLFVWSVLRSQGATGGRPALYSAAAPLFCHFIMSLRIHLVVDGIQAAAAFERIEHSNCARNLFQADFKCPYLELVLFDFYEIWNITLKWRPTNTAQIS